MKHLLAVVVFLFSLTDASVAQSPADSLLQVRNDSIAKIREAKELAARADSIRKAGIETARLNDSIALITADIRRKQAIRNFQETLRRNSLFHFFGKPELLTIDIREVKNNDGIFYFMLGLILYFALLRLFFYKYLTTLFTLFFRATLRQQQLREQLLQSPLPALLLNIFFVINIGVYCSFIALHYRFPVPQNFWVTLAYCVAIVAIIYTIKFIVLKVAGWIFGISQVTDTYIFVVFLINKMIGIFILPVLVLMAFPNVFILPVALVISFVLLASLFLYRFIISYRPIRNEIKLNRLHFFLYLCAFEIAPLLLIYKVLLALAVSSY